MGTAERRLEMLKYLCQKRYAKMAELAKIFGVSVRTIQRDIYEIETVFRVPIDVKSGKYNGGVYIVGDYTLYRAYMRDDEIILLLKVRILVCSQLSDWENRLFDEIINVYSKVAS